MKIMESKLISVAKDFSPSPAGRHVKDGPYPGEVFRDTILVPALKAYKNVVVDFDGTEACGSSFLDEAFGGLVYKAGFSVKSLKEILHLHASRKSYEAKVWGYIAEASQREKISGRA